MTISYYHNNTQSLGEHDKNIFQILRSMASDEYDCHYCIDHHTTHHDITEILRIHDALIERQTRLVRLTAQNTGTKMFRVLLDHPIYYYIKYR